MAWRNGRIAISMLHSLILRLDDVMIDYDKIKFAHKLAIKWHEDALISVQFWSNHPEQYDYRLELHGITQYLTGDIEFIIDRLIELTRPPYKYKEGDRIWFAWDNEIKSDKISDIFLSENHGWLYDTEKYHHIKERNAFPSRESLIDSQIAYWYSMRDPTKPPTFDDYYPQFEGQIRGFNE